MRIDAHQHYWNIARGDRIYSQIESVAGVVG